MKITLAATPLSPGVWRAAVPIDDLAFLGKASQAVGDTSVVLLSRGPNDDPGGLSFEPSSAIVLNRGATENTVIVVSTEPAALDASARRATAPGPGVTSGDTTFLTSLTPALEPLGQQLLAEVRRRWPGELRLHAASKRFVESPDNYWTVKIQPRDGSLRITVRGEPSRLGAHGSLDVKRDQNGYSTFKISREADVPDVISLLSRVRRR